MQTEISLSTAEAEHISLSQLEEIQYHFRDYQEK